ncbi:uncharacterized protein PAN0_003c1754 [Moesziomyces antarcticus]|uniref:WKF domain-containing protein n=1 Tax=Pseudozyma antarctica TaxID=84753 RepID=A0A5C3FL38_PSEA2|nr:uncharacterized protein PAN0_003c1754 [Moesziomyces antarcticus]GAK63549.1 conserved hypothetical protein [Moesziomyces antarcticus]SPO44139.1 uncharacterized protein PSANT_01824 [Moesziomyces antarcticus]
MSSEATAAQAGPSRSATKEKKPKRVRKRSRNKKRTTEAEESSSSSSDDSDSDDDAPTPVIAPKPDTKKETKSKSTPAKAASDSEDSDDDDADDGKRKRKRKRTSKKKSVPTTSEPGPTTTTTSTPAAAASSGGQTFSLTAEEAGPDPTSDLRLSEQAKQAIQYAQIYTADKPHWKFNKAKQNWLLRNALSVPPSDYDAALARKSAAAQDGEEAEQDDGGENFVPEDFVGVVTAYLSSVVGGARQRLVESLREAVNAPVVVVPQPEAEAAPQAAEQTEQAEGKKSVSFGNIALDSEKKDEAVQAAGLPAGTDPESVELRRQRATLMLQRLGETV